MTDNKKLIEEAAKAIFAEEQCDRHQKRNAASVTENWEGRLGDADKDEYLSFARAALAVFEKAHTPTDDEREDMIAFLLRDHNFEESPWGRTYTDAEIANALRHSVVPEPQSEPSNRVIVMCARCGLFPVVGGDEINSDIVVCDRCAFAEGRESAQGEPSDAHDDDCEAEYVVGAAGYTDCGCAERAEGGREAARPRVIDALVMTRLSDFAGTDMGVIEEAADAVINALGIRGKEEK